MGVTSFGGMTLVVPCWSVMTTVKTVALDECNFFWRHDFSRALGVSTKLTSPHVYPLLSHL